MPLPILHSTHEATPEDLLRFYLRTELHWSEQLAQETELDVGTALVNAELSGLGEANRVLSAALPEEMSPPQAVAQVETHFAAAGARCQAWMMNPSATASRADLLAQHLLSCGYRRVFTDLYCLAGSPRVPIREVGGLHIIPARASFRHTSQLARQEAQELSKPHWEQAVLDHLDDQHTDALLALKDDQSSAAVSVLAVGELGAIHNLYVSPSLRRAGLGRTMLSRALEICARSVFRYVFAQIAPGNPAAELFRSAGFGKIGAVVSYEV